MIMIVGCAGTVFGQIRISAGGGDQGEHEHHYASLREIDLEFRDFSFPTLDGKPIRLSEAIGDGKVVLIHYFAAWCHNSKYDVVTINELYRRYRDSGLIVIGVCEYSDKKGLKKFIGDYRPEYPICMEGENKLANRTGTTHYRYRMQAGDTRDWGTPLNILFFRNEIKNDGGIIAPRVRAATGELIKTEVEELIHKKLSEN